MRSCPNGVRQGSCRAHPPTCGSVRWTPPRSLSLLGYIFLPLLSGRSGGLFRSSMNPGWIQAGKSSGSTPRGRRPMTSRDDKAPRPQSVSWIFPFLASRFCSRTFPLPTGAPISAFVPGHRAVLAKSRRGCLFLFPKARLNRSVPSTFATTLGEPGFGRCIPYY